MSTHTKANYCKAIVVIVDYLKAHRVVENVESLIRQDNSSDIEICVVDNSCDPENNETLLRINKHKNVHLIFNSKNLGYTRACNYAAGLFDTSYVVLVNPDISWKDNSTLSDLISLMDAQPDIGVLGPRQINDDGTTPNTVRAFPNFPIQVAGRTPLRLLPKIKKWVNNYEMKDFDYNKSQYVDWFQSSFMVIRSDLWQRLGGLDTAYFLFMSDPEICFRAWSLGYKVLYTADSVVGADGIRCSSGGFFHVFKNKSVGFRAGGNSTKIKIL